MRWNGYFLALCYDPKEEYLAAGFSEEAVAEFDDEGTIAALKDALCQLEYTVERVPQGRRLASLLASGRRWSFVFNLAEGVWGRSREAQVPALCELFDQPYTFSDPLTCGLTLDKAAAKRLIRDLGLPTAPFTVVDSIEQLSTISVEKPLFVKPVAEGNSKGISQSSRVGNHAELAEVCGEFLDRYRQPLLVEEYLPGREVTVGIIGNGREASVLGVMEIDFAHGADSVGYTAVNKRERKERLAFRLVSGEPLASQAADLALAAYRALACRDAARIDLRCDEGGQLHFLEANALPGLHPTLSDLPRIGALAGVAYPELLSRILRAAAGRYEAP